MMSGKWMGSPPKREDVLAEIGRELSYRRRLYPKWLSEGKYGITEKNMAERIDALQAAYDYISAHWPKTQQELI